MKASFRLAWLTAVFAAGGAQAMADPLGDLLAGAKGALCYDRVYDAAHLARNPNQQTRAIRMALTDHPGTDGAIIRVAIGGAGGTRYIVGECTWSDEANLDVQGEPLIASFKAKAGVACHATTSVDGFSAEEGGDFPIDLRDGRSVMLHLPDDGIAGWSSFDRTEPAPFFELGTEDRVFRLDRADAGLCAELNDKLPWW